MEPTIDFIMRQDAHVFESLKLADQKAQAIIALSAGAAYLMVEWGRGPRHPHWFLKVIRTLAVLMLLLSGGLSLWAIYPPTGIADRHVYGGHLTRPHQIVRLSQNEFTRRILHATDTQRAEEAAALLYARSKIREWKFKRFKWSVISVIISYNLVALYMVASTSMDRHFRKTSTIQVLHSHKQLAIHDTVVEAVSRNGTPRDANSITQ